MHSVEKIPETVYRFTSSGAMQVGQIGRIAPGEHYAGKYLIRHYSGYVLLDNPRTSWTDYDPGLKVELLLPGEVLRIKVGL